MSLNKNKKQNYNFVVKICISIFIINFLMMFMLACLNLMFYKANFYNNNYQSQIVNIDNTPKFDKININTCSFQALDGLEGIGEVKANKIINNRPYKDIYELRKVIGEKTFNNIKEYIKI